MSRRDTYLQRTYGISEAEYHILLGSHWGKCWICGREPKPGRNLSVDHDHKTARMTGEVRRSVRGLLCFMCNKKLIGRNRREHSYLYENAVQYLNSNLAQEVLGGNPVHTHFGKAKRVPNKKASPAKAPQATGGGTLSDVGSGC